MEQAKARDVAALQLPASKGLAIPAAPDIQILPQQDKRKYIIVPYRAATDRRITPAQMRVLQIVCSYCNKAGITWASQARMAQDLGIKRQTFSNTLKKLKQLGYVRVEGRAWKSTRGATLRVMFDPTQSLTDILATINDPECIPPEFKPDRPIYTEEDLMPAKKKQLQQKHSVNHESMPTLTTPETAQTERIGFDDAVRVAFRYVVNVDENALRWLGLALELGCTRSMLETCSREGDPVAAIKVLVTRLDAACR